MDDLLSVILTSCRQGLLRENCWGEGFGLLMTVNFVLDRTTWIDTVQITVTPGYGLIKGWSQGVFKMREGERAILHVPGIQWCSVPDNLFALNSVW